MSSARSALRLLVCTATVGVITVVAPSARAQSPDSTRATPRRLIGVFDAATGSAIPGVQVRDGFNGSFVVTNAEGMSPLWWLSYRGMAGVVELRKLGYQPKTILVSREDTTSITAILDPVVTLAPVITRERYRVDRDAGRWEGFDERCASGSPTCFRLNDLAKHPVSNLADFIIKANGVTIGGCGGPRDRQTQCGRIAMRSSVIPPSYCEPTFFVDGFEWGSHTPPPSDMVPGRPAEAPFIPSNVKGIEVYPTGRSRPGRFAGNPLCGAVVIWTK